MTGGWGEGKIETQIKIMENGQSNNNEFKFDYSDLVQFISDKFDEADRKLDEKLEAKLNEKLEAKLNEKLVGMATKTDINRVLTRIGDLSNKVDDYRAEQLGIKKQVEKHDKWHHLTAEKVGLELE